MATSVVLVNGLPGSGKSTLGAALARRLGWPLLAKDAIKETLAGAITAEVPSRQLGIAAMETVWTAAAALPGPVLVDSWWFRPRDLAHARKGLAASGALSTAEVWCDVPVAVARARYERRRRHDVHQDARDMTEEWAQWGAEGAPLGIGPVLKADTGSPIALDELATAVRDALAAPEATPVTPRAYGH